MDYLAGIRNGDPDVDAPTHNIYDEKLAREIEQVIGNAIPDQDITVCGLVEREDEDGESHLVIDLHYVRSNAPIRAEYNAQMIYDVRELLAQHGDLRFPHIHHNLPEGQPVAGYC